MDRNKYLYWFDPDDPSFDDELVQREMQSRIGFLIQAIQMVEYNIANILSIEEFEKEKKQVFTMEEIADIKQRIAKRFQEYSSRKYTFGVLAKEAKTSTYLKDMDQNLLDEVVDYRNYLAHRCFKEKLLEGTLKTAEDADRFVDELNDYEEKVVRLNEYVKSVFEKRKIMSLLIKTEAPIY